MLYLKNGTYINPVTFEFSKVNIAVENGHEGKIYFTDTIPENAQIIDCNGMFITKSFVVGHHHAYSGLATGMPPPAKAPQNFSQILQYVWWNLDKKLDADEIKASAYVTAIAAALNGSTFIIDHHASPFSIKNSLNIIAKAFNEVGVSHLLCYEISDRDGKDIAQKGIDETDDYLKNNQGLVGLHASFTVGNETLKKAADLMNKHNSGIHIHVAEDIVDQDLCIKEHQTKVVQRLNYFGFLSSSKTILAHALHIDENERNILNNSNAYIVQNPDSNLNNGVGFFTRKGLNNNNLMLGTDGMHSDMFKSAQTAFFAGNLFDSPQLNDVYSQLRNNHKYIEKNNFKGDGNNNLIIFNYKNNTAFNQNNFIGHFFYALNSSNVEHVISNGEIIVRNKKITKVNHSEIIEFAKIQAKKLWNKL
ncbi:MAG: amidohydrolase family protein [Bacteroidales bacterium]|nr:amidohydrolase family protein [Bacteroidales bacterium]